jgi:hypothetical protein
MEVAMSLRKAVVILLLVPFVTVDTSQAGERTITRNQMPQAVREAVDRLIQDAVVKSYKTEIENGKREYEIETTRNGHGKDITLSPDGHVMEIEEEVALEALPPAVASGLRENARGGKIVKVESISKEGIIVAYETQITRSGKHSEVQVGPDGRNLDHQE